MTIINCAKSIISAKKNKTLMTNNHPKTEGRCLTETDFIRRANKMTNTQKQIAATTENDNKRNSGKLTTSFDGYDSSQETITVTKKENS